MELNGNYNVASGSVEDLSEYTDADESMSAPTEILAEVKSFKQITLYNKKILFFQTKNYFCKIQIFQFLSALMLKDYETALKYCKISKYNTNQIYL